MYDLFWEEREIIVMQDRFKFNAIVSSYYDIDTPENYEEFEPKFYLKMLTYFVQVK